MRNRIGIEIALLIAVCITPLASAEGQDWPQFRGIHRDGVSTETGLLDSWGESGPTEVWRVPLGPGYSGIAVVGDRLYTMYAADDGDRSIEYAASLSTADGTELWRTALGERYDNEFGNGPRATPTVVDGHVYVLDSNGLLAALKAKDGAIVWSMDFKEKFGVDTPNFGYAGSVVVDGDQLIVQAGGGDDQNYLGIDRKTGEILWARGSGGVGYNSALPVTVGGNKRFVYVAGEELLCVDAAGEQVWSHPWPPGETHAMPIRIPPDKVYLSGAEGVGARLFRVTEKKGQAEVELVWEQPFMRNHFSSAVVDGDTIYGFDNATLKAISVKDGSMAWGKRGMGKGSLIVADGHLLVLSDRGKLRLIEATPDGYNEKASVQALEGLCWTSPTLAHGRLYLRNHDELVVYEMR